MKRLNQKIIFILFATGLSLAAFQNCSKSTFSSGSLNELTQLSLANGGGLPPMTTASLPINAGSPNTLLSQSGLQSIQDLDTLINFQEYVPQYPLYSDSASKRRWAYLPAGSIINSSNPDDWVYPKGTIFFKEFSYGGKKIETRLWEKTGDGVGINNWRASVYAWKADQSDAVLYEGDFYAQAEDAQMQYAAYAVRDNYKVLNTATCIKCHSSAGDVVNGFNYLQLSNTDAKVNIFSVKNLNWLSNPPMVIDEIKGSPAAKAAIGYIQANCATCHNGVLQARNFKHSSNNLTYEDENIVKELANTYVTMPLITFGDPENSYIYIRQGNRQMPPINLIVADPVGQQVLSDWINDSASAPATPQ